MNVLNRIIKLINKCDAKDIKIFDLNKKYIISDFIIICTGVTKYHNKYIYIEIVKKFKKYILNKNIEMDKNLEWIIIDLNKIILHIMQKDIRLFYNLENLLENYK